MWDFPFTTQNWNLSPLSCLKYSSDAAVSLLARTWVVNNTYIYLPYYARLKMMSWRTKCLAVKGFFAKYSNSNDFHATYLKWLLWITRKCHAFWNLFFFERKHEQFFKGSMQWETKRGEILICLNFDPVRLFIGLFFPSFLWPKAVIMQCLRMGFH